MRILVITSALFLFILVPVTWAQGTQEIRKIPKDLEIRFIQGGTIQFGTYYTCTIRADGRVTIEYQSHGLPTGRRVGDLRLKGQPKPPKLPKKKERLSRTQLIELMNAFDSSGFFAMRDRYWGDPKVDAQACINHAEAKGLSILASGRKKETSFFLGCSYDTVPEFKRFNELFDTISAILSAVRITEVHPEGN